MGREGHGLCRQALERLANVAVVPTCEVVARALGLEGDLGVARLLSPRHSEEGVDGRAAGAVEGHPAAVGHLRVDLHGLGAAERGPLGEGDRALGIDEPSGEALGGRLDEGLGRRRGGGRVDGLALGARLGPQDVLAPHIHEVDVADLLEGRGNPYHWLLGRALINRHARRSQIENVAVLVLPSDELEAVLGGSRRGHKRLAPLDLLGIDELAVHIEVISDGHLVRRGHYIDGEVLDVEGLDVGLGLAGVDLGHGRGVIGHVVDGHVLAFEVRIEEADVHLAVGLDLLAVLDEGHVDGLVAVESLALLGHGFFDSLAHGAVAHALGVNLGPGGDDAGFGGHLHGDAADVGVALERLGSGGLLGCSLALLRHGGRLGLGGGLGLVHLLRGLLRFRAVGLVLGLRLGLFDILQRGDDLSAVSLGGGVGARVVREHGHVQEREHQKHRQQD